MCGSPKLIAACHVLHRLFLPRHPPCALSSLTIELTPCRKLVLTATCVHMRHLDKFACMALAAPAYECSFHILNHSKTLNLRQLTLLACLVAAGTELLLSLVIYLPNRFRCQTSRHASLARCLSPQAIELTAAWPHLAGLAHWSAQSSKPAAQFPRCLRRIPALSSFSYYLIAWWS